MKWNKKKTVVGGMAAMAALASIATASASNAGNVRATASHGQAAADFGLTDHPLAGAESREAYNSLKRAMNGAGVELNGFSSARSIGDPKSGASGVVVPQDDGSLCVHIELQGLIGSGACLSDFEADGAAGSTSIVDGLFVVSGIATSDVEDVTLRLENGSRELNIENGVYSWTGPTSGDVPIGLSITRRGETTEKHFGQDLREQANEAAKHAEAGRNASPADILR